MTNRSRGLARSGKFLLAAIVVTVSFAVLAHAVQTVTTPSAMSVTYNLTPGSNSSNITPPANLPALILADQTTAGCVNSSLMTVVNSAGQDGELVWNGFETRAQGLTQGFSPNAGTHIVYADFCNFVDLEVTNATSFHVHNASNSSITAKGNVTLIW